MGQNTPLVFRSGQRPFTHPLLPQRRKDRRVARAVIAPPPSLQKTTPLRKVTDDLQAARHPRVSPQDGSFWLWQTTKGVAISFLDLVRSSRPSWPGEKRVSAAGSLDQASLLGDTTRRAVEVNITCTKSGKPYLAVKVHLLYAAHICSFELSGRGTV